MALCSLHCGFAKVYSRVRYKLLSLLDHNRPHFLFRVFLPRSSWKTYEGFLLLLLGFFVVVLFVLFLLPWRESEAQHK